jgi:hypothetical protein
VRGQPTDKTHKFANWLIVEGIVLTIHMELSSAPFFDFVLSEIKPPLFTQIHPDSMFRQCERLIKMLEKEQTSDVVPPPFLVLEEKNLSNIIGCGCWHNDIVDKATKYTDSEHSWLQTHGVKNVGIH